MKKIIQKIKARYKKYTGHSLKTPRTLVLFLLINLVLIWLKTSLNYFANFSLGVQGPVQYFLAIFNSIPTAVILLSIGLFFKGKWAYWWMWIVNLLNSLWLFANVLYYREFSDFISFGVMGASDSVENNLTKSIVAILHMSDLLIFLDLVILAFLLIRHRIPMDGKKIQRRFAGMTMLLGFALMLVGFGISDNNRPGLLTRSFDNNYIVKYLGLNEYAFYNAVQTRNQTASRKKAEAKDLKPVQEFLNRHQTPANVEYFGTQKSKNVFAFHLESFQQFLIDYKVGDQEVTPNLNAFYHDQSTLSFDNFFNQVGQGKTADAETMLENSMYGLPTGSAMVKYGTNNTFMAAPTILGQNGYTSAAFHGDVATFWNRDNTYKSWGYNFFFSKSFYKNAAKKENNIGYGMKDKLFLKDSAQYIEQLPQPFYAKMITVTNHYPYEVDKQMDEDFPATETGDKTVDHYVQTAHYLDQSFKDFIDWLKDTGLYDNSVIYVYGDHYGISNNHKPAIAKLLGKDKITNYDLAMFQKVPFMVHAEGMKGGINHTYGGEIDVLPTLLDLLGIPQNNLVLFGGDLLSSQHNQIVPFRDGDWVSPQYTEYGNQYFKTGSGDEVDYDKLSKAEKRKIHATQSYVHQVLHYSDQVMTGDLLRFHHFDEYRVPKRSNFNYRLKESLAQLKRLQNERPSSVKAKNGNKSQVDLYHYDAETDGTKKSSDK